VTHDPTRDRLREEVAALLARRRLGGLDVPAQTLSAGDALRLAAHVGARLGVDLRADDVHRLGSLPELIDLGLRLAGSSDHDRHDGAPVPLSHTQSRFLLHEQLSPGEDDNHVVLAYRLAGPVDLDALRLALSDVVTRHPVLRSVFTWDDDLGAIQRALPPDTVELTEVEAAGDNVEELAAAVCADWWDDPFDLEFDPPLRARAVPLPGGLLLCLSMHHIAFDGGSESVLIGDLGAAYACRVEGREPDLPPALAYRSYAWWERSQLGAWQEQDVPFWREVLADVPVSPVPAPAADHQVPREEFEVVLDAARVRGFTSALRAARAIPLAGLLCGVAEALGDTFGTEEVCLGTMSSGRFEKAFAPVVGSFVNPMAIPMRTGPSGSRADWASETARRVVACLRHARTPYDELVRLVAAGRGREPLFRVWVALQAPPVPGEFGGGVRVEPVLVSAPRTGTELVVEAAPEPTGEWRVSAYWRSDGIDRATGRAVVERLARSLADFGEVTGAAA
jgi:hypothetical protein